MVPFERWLAACSFPRPVSCTGRHNVRGERGAWQTRVRQIAVAGRCIRTQRIDVTAPWSHVNGG